MASHAMWFHRPPLTGWRADDWLLYDLDSPSVAAARGYNRGAIFTSGGRLIASTMQEGLIRPVYRRSLAYRAVRKIARMTGFGHRFAR